MFLHLSLEAKIEATEKKIRELEQEQKLLTKEVEQYFQDLKLTPDQLDAFFNVSSNFSPEVWSELEKQRQELEAKIDAKIQSVSDPRKIKKNQKDRQLPHYALFVR